jgi:uncharacterized protein (DUF362 family)
MAQKVLFSTSTSRRAFVGRVLDRYQEQIHGRVLIKPNLVSHEPYPTTTHPDLLDAVIIWLKNKGMEVLCGDGRAIDARRSKMRDTAIRRVCQAQQLELLDFYELPQQTYSTPRGWTVKMVTLPMEVDTIISLPVLKTHPPRRLRMTGALKNVVGYFSTLERLRLHVPIIKKDPFRTIAEANWLLREKSQLIIMDGVRTLLHANEVRHGGKLAELGYLMAGTCPVALDVFGFELLRRIEPQYRGKEPSYVRYISEAAAIGVGSPEPDPEEIRL